MKKFFTTLLMLTAMVSMNAQEEQNVYILGNVGDQIWEPSIGTQMEYVEGMYEYEGHFNASSYFSFTTQLAETPGDWDGIAQYRFGASSDGYLIDDNNLGEYIQCGEIEESRNNAFCFPVGGTYHIYLELEERIMMVERVGGPDVEPDPVDEGDIYVIGKFVGVNWASNSGLKMEKGEDGIFTANINVADSLTEFSFTHALAQTMANWDGIQPFRFACAEEDPTVVLGEVMHVTEDGVTEPVFLIDPGYYLLTLDMNNRTLVVTEAEKETGIFIIGNVPFGDWKPENAIKMEQDGDIFTYDVTINGDVWFIFSGDYGTWDAVNALRYGPLEDNEDVIVGQEMTTQLSTNTNASYKISGNGDYTITFDLANLTFKFEGGSGTPGVRGDVDGSGIVDVEDVNAAINIILKLNNAGDYPGSADLDNNGMVDVEDVNAIINIILKL